MQLVGLVNNAGILVRRMLCVAVKIIITSLMFLLLLATGAPAVVLSPLIVRFVVPKGDAWSCRVDRSGRLQENHGCQSLWHRQGDKQRIALAATITRSSTHSYHNYSIHNRMCDCVARVCRFFVNNFYHN